MSYLILAAALVGSVTYYSENLMEEVYAHRLAWHHVKPCADCIGMVALLDRAHVGKRVWLQRPGHAAEKFLVVDCAADNDRERLRKRGLVAEVDWRTAQRWRREGRGWPASIRVLFEQPYKEDERWLSMHLRMIGD